MSQGEDLNIRKTRNGIFRKAPCHPKQHPGVKLNRYDKPIEIDSIQFNALLKSNRVSDFQAEFVKFIREKLREEIPKVGPPGLVKGDVSIGTE